MKEQMKKVAKKAVQQHEKTMHKGAKKMAKGGKSMPMKVVKPKPRGGR